MCGLAASFGHPLYSQNIFRDMRCTWEECKRAGVVSFAALPLRDGDEVIGVLAMASVTPRNFQRQSSFLEAMAETVSASLRNARLFDQTKRTEEALHRSEEHYRLLAEYARDMIWVMDLSGRLSYMSPASESLTGYAPEEVLGKQFDSLLTPASAAVARKVYDEEFAKLQSGQPVGGPRLEVEHVRKDGSTFWAEVNSCLLYDRMGTVIGVQGVTRNIDDRKCAEQALRDTTEKLSAVIRASVHAIIALDGQGNVTVWSPSAERMFGWSEQEAIGRPLPYVAPEKLQEHLAIRRKVLEEGQSIVFEVLRRRKDGSHILLEISASPLRDPAGRIIGVMGIHADITDRKRTEEALQVGRERLRQAVRVAGLGIFDHDHVSDVVEWSREIRTICGFEPGEQVSLATWIQFIHPEDRQKIAQAIADAHDPASDGLYAVEHRIVRRDGEVRWLSIRSQTFFEGRGRDRRAVRTIGAVLDTTERKQAEEDLRRSEEKFRAIADYTYDWENWVGPDGRLLWVNSAVERMTGYSPREVMAMEDFPKPLVLEEDWPMVLASFRKAVHERGTEPSMEFRMRRKDGRIVWGSVAAQAIYDDQGRCMGHRSSIRDITDRKRAEEALRESQERYMRAIETTGTGYLILDDQGRVADANQEYVRLAGRQRLEEILGHSVLEWTAPHNVDRNRREIERCFEQGFVRNLAIDYLTPAGRIIPVEISATVLRTADTARF